MANSLGVLFLLLALFLCPGSAEAQQSQHAPPQLARVPAWNGCGPAETPVRKVPQTRPGDQST
jgi:hypothetical protein